MLSRDLCKTEDLINNSKVQCLHSYILVLTNLFRRKKIYYIWLIEDCQKQLFSTSLDILVYPTDNDTSIHIFSTEIDEVRYYFLWIRVNSFMTNALMFKIKLDCEEILQLKFIHKTTFYQNLSLSLYRSFIIIFHP